MNSRFASALLFAVVTANTAAQAPTRADSAVVAKALDAVRTFQKTWEREWLAGMRARAGRMNNLPPGTRFAGHTVTWANGRAMEERCAFSMDDPQIFLPDHAWGLYITKRAIQSAVNEKHWVCPNWLPPDDYYISGPQLADERLNIDNALEPAMRRRVLLARDTLIRTLGLAVARVPGDSVLVGQYIRILGDAGKYAEALTALDNCRTRSSWCAALRAHVSYRLGQVFDAEDAFIASLDSLSPAERCAWASIVSILDEEARRTYSRMHCVQQDSINQIVWWLAHPLWSVPGNERLVEQMSRRVLIAMRSGLRRDERYNWMPQAGGDALTEVIERYGWASFAHYSPLYGVRFLPDRTDIYSRTAKDSAERRLARSLGGRKTTFEYSIGRVHVIPPMTMVNDPFSITNADWSMNAPGGGLDFTFSWWPVEHYAPSHPLVKLVDQQTAFLRRQDSVLLAFATNLARTDLARRLGDSVTGVILASSRPGLIRRLGDKRVGAQDRLTFLTALPAGPSLVSVEVPWVNDGDRGARSRFGVKPPPPLSSMTRGEIAMSDPVVLIVPANTTALPVAADAAVALMNGSTTLAAGTSSVGIYWETYGIAAGDSVDITLTIQRNGGGGPPVTTSWSEPQPGRNVRTVAGTIPIQIRSVVLDISAIPIGTYTLDIAVRKRGAAALTSAREFTIR